MKTPFIQDQTNFKDTYDETKDGTIFNAFAAAALRFGHTILHRNVGQMDADFNLLNVDNLENNFFQPDIYHSQNGTGHHNVLRWATSTKCPMADRCAGRSYNYN